MKKLFIRQSILAVLALSLVTGSKAGNPDRIGQAGATELLINPWAGTSGMNGIFTAGVRGLEAERLNVAGLAFVKKTEIAFTRTQWLQGSGIGINAAGIAQRIGESSVLALSVMSMDIGKIEITNALNPDGGLGYYSPSLVNIGVSYARTFSERIYGGVTARIISQSTTDVSSEGIAFDAGIHYQTGKDNRLKFGIALRNVGTPMRFGGDGFSARSIPEGADIKLTMNQRSDKYDIPSLMNIGMSYDIPLSTDGFHKITLAGNFTSNSFSNDQYGLGFEYNFGKIFALRSGYNYEKGILSKDTRTSAYTGLAFGFSVNLPMNESGSKFGLDFSYRTTDPFNGTYAVGARFTL